MGLPEDRNSGGSGAASRGHGVVLVRAGKAAATLSNGGLVIASFIKEPGSVSRRVSLEEIGDASNGVTLCIYSFNLFARGSVDYRCAPAVCWLHKWFGVWCRGS